MIILKKYYFFLTFIFIQSIFSMNHARRLESNEYDYSSSSESTNSSQQEQKEEELLKSITENATQTTDSEETQKAAIMVNEGLALLNNKEDRTATAVFEIPKRSEHYVLSEEQKERIKKLFEVYESRNNGPHKVIKFRYTDSNLLPETRDQAIFLLYSPYIKMNIEELKSFSARIDCPLNEVQKKAISEKMAITQEIIKRAKEEYEKNKSTQPKTISSVPTQIKEGLIASTLIKTDKGHCRIGDLKVGQLVCCYNTKSGTEILSKITHVDRIHVHSHIQIIINNETIRVAPDHKFYINAEDVWIKARDLKDNSELRQLVDPRIQDVKEVGEALHVIRISVNENHNFYISDHNILVHNYIPIVIAAEAAFEWGGGMVLSWSVLQPTLTAMAHGLIYWIGSLFRNNPDDIPQPAKGFGGNPAIAAFINREYENRELLRNNKAPQTPKTNNNDNSNSKNSNNQDPKDPKKDKEKNKTVLKLIKESEQGKETRGRSTQFEKPKETHEDALKDFDKFTPKDIKDKGDIKIGKLDDGRTINVRKASRDSRPTLEIYDEITRQSIKFRYGIK